MFRLDSVSFLKIQMLKMKMYISYNNLNILNIILTPP